MKLIPIIKYICCISIIFLNTVKLEGSDLLSLSSLEREQKHIYILGINQLIEKAINIYQGFISQLSSESSKSAFIFFNPKEEIKELATTSSSVLGIFSHEAAKNNFKQGNLDYITFESNQSDALEEVEIILSHSIAPLNQSAFLLIIGRTLLPNYLLNDYRDFTTIEKGKPNLFFINNQNFQQLKTLLLKETKKHHQKTDLSLKNYFKLLEVYDKKIMQASQDTLAYLLKDTWTQAKEVASRYVQTYAKNALEISHLELCLRIIAEKKSFIAGLEEYQLMIWTPLNKIIAFEQFEVLSKTIDNYDKILFCYKFNNVKPIAHSLGKIGFKGHHQGMTPDNEEFLMFNLETSKLTSNDISQFFYSIIKGNSDLSTHIENNDSLLYLNKKNHSLKECTMCGHSTKAFNACAETETSTYCSLTCLLKKIHTEDTTEHKLSRLLGECYILTNEEKLILKQFGALCYLRAALLMPSFNQECGIVYQLQILHILSLLEKIEIQAKDTTTSWGKTVLLAKYWGIKLPDLKLFLSVYKQVKQTYLQTLLKNSLNQSYTSLGAKQFTSFDEKEICANLQKTAFSNLKKAFNLSVPTTKDISLLFLYYELIEQINKRVGLPLEKIEDLLAVTYSEHTLTELLQHIGYTENPFIFNRKNTKKKERLRLNDKNLSDEESSEDGIRCNSIYSLPNISHTIHSTDERDFKIVHQNERKKIRTIRSLFAGYKPYTISLFRTRKYVPQELQEAQKHWGNGKKTLESMRIKILFALADSLVGDSCNVILNNYRCPLIECNDENYDLTIREKLDLHHLFTRHVDSSLQSYGIAELVDNLVQVSIPGEITDEQGKKEVGFFQYCFTRDSWICIHRCFKPYDANQSGAYITTHLRRILYDFLKNVDSSYEYNGIIKHLEELIGQGK
ncbi:hypothetical protein H0X06_02830 [Candidatus Dependentiae bacterium]|nr:hypothetical protein [Candidatus Dependentiae bacterium]